MFELTVGNGPLNWETCMSGIWQPPLRWYLGRGGKVIHLYCDNTPVIDRLRITGDFNRSEAMYPNETIISIANVDVYKAGIYYQHDLPP